MLVAGKACLLLALAICAYGVGASLYGARTGRREWVASGRRAVYALAGGGAGGLVLPGGGAGRGRLRDPGGGVPALGLLVRARRLPPVAHAPRFLRGRRAWVIA